MKKLYFLIFIIFNVFLLTSCNKDNDNITNSNEQEMIKLKAENESLKKELEENKTSSGEELQSLNKVETGTTIKQEEKVQVSQEDINLAGCKETKKVGNIEWCMKNTELVKEVEGYDTRFSKSIQNDSGFKGLYESENTDKLYTFEYLEKACGVYTDEGLIIDSSVKETCPCPIGYHIPTPKEWNDSFLYYKENLNLFKNELGFNKDTMTRTDKGDYIKNGGLSMNNRYFTNSIGQNGGILVINLNEKYSSYDSFMSEKKNAMPIRCIKNN